MLTLSERTFADIAGLMHEACGLSFPASKKPLIYSRLSSRIQKLGLPSFEQYLALIASGGDHGEFQVAVDLLTTNETYFFREPEHFKLLEQELPRMGRRPLSVWSAASSFGDEAYSTAMVLADLAQSGRIEPDWSILGTDISDRVLQSAADAVFPEQRLHAVAPERLRRYCLRGEGDAEGLVQIQDKLRSHVRFGWLNLCRPIENLGPFDVIFLRNVLIYFDPPTKTAVVDRVLSQLRPGGLFFIGTAEGRVPSSAPLDFVRPGAFRKPAG
jgi:chemotaxis protein methyltransferase CheR